MMNNAATQRVIALVDMDCFYCQVETRLNPSLKGKPVAVVQYNQWKGGGIIAVNYEARDKGVSRHMRGDEAKEICPEITLVPVPTIRGKADLSNYREAGDEVAQVFSEFSDCVQRASIDEAYLDLTKAVEEFVKNSNEDVNVDDFPNTFVVGYCDLKNNKNEDDRKKGLEQWLNNIKNEETKDSPDYCLAVGAKIVEKMRREVFNRTGFHCSAGIAHNKILSKLTAGLHKPKKQTVLPQDGVPELFDTLPIHKVRNLGGKLGKQVAEKLSIKFMSELYRFTLEQLQQKFDGKTSHWLYNIARGIDLEPVTSRMRPESIGCCKNFTGKNALTTKTEVEHWLKELATEISERLYKDLERNKRRAKLLTVSFSQDVPMSRCGALNSYEISKIVAESLDLLKKFNNASPNEDVWTPPIKYLGLAASKFTEEVSSIEKYLTHTNNSEGTSKSLSLPISKTKNESKKPEIVKFLKKSEKTDVRPSFFIKYLNEKKEMAEEKEKNKQSPPEDKEKNKQSPTEEKPEETEEETWVSLSEVFPDIKQAEPEVIEILPEPLQKKAKERLQPSSSDVSPTEVCSECGKSIPLTEFPEHSDFHAALKLNAEINKMTVKTAKAPAKTKQKETLTKRKRKEPVTPSKKMKSLSHFFVPLAKK